MRFKTLSLPLLVLLGASAAMALELGEVTVLSVLGQPFKAEVQLLEAASDARLGAECFRISSDDNPRTGIPSLARGYVTLVRGSGKARLIIVTDQVINEPAAQFNLRVVCGPLQYRSYLALMDPASLGVSRNAEEEAAIRSAAQQNVAGPEWQCAEGESARSIAASIFPNNSTAQSRFLSALLTANPDRALGASGEKRLAAGTLLRLPETRHLPESKRAKEAKAPFAEPSPTTAPALASPPLAEQVRALEASLSNSLPATKSVDQAAVGLPLPAAPAAPALAPLGPLPASMSPTVAASPAALPKTPPPPASEAAHELGITDFLRELAAEWWLEILAFLGLISLLLLWRSVKLRRLRKGIAHKLSTDQAANKAVWRDPISIIEEDARSAAKAVPEPQDLGSAPLAADRGVEEIKAWPEQPAGPLALKEEHEFNPVMELAEIMLSFGRVKGAAQALQEYIEKNPNEALQPWMKLLEVYRQGDMHEEFTSASEKLKLHFNVAPADWDSMADRVSPPVALVDEETASIEQLLSHLPNIARMSRIRDEVTRTWDSPEGFDYLNGLLRDNRAGERQGFPLATVSELLYLMDILEKRLSHLPR